MLQISFTINTFRMNDIAMSFCNCKPDFRVGMLIVLYITICNGEKMNQRGWIRSSRRALLYQLVAGVNARLSFFRFEPSETRLVSTLVHGQPLSLAQTGSLILTTLKLKGEKPNKVIFERQEVWLNAASLQASDSISVSRLILSEQANTFSNRLGVHTKIILVVEKNYFNYVAWFYLICNLPIYILFSLYFIVLSIFKIFYECWQSNS